MKLDWHRHFDNTGILRQVWAVDFGFGAASKQIVY